VKFGRRTLRLFTPALLFAACAPCAFAQALHTATQPMSLSAWGGATGTFVNLAPTNAIGDTTLFNSGRNLGITAGVDLRVWQFHGLLPSIEIRGTYPMAKGTVASEENGLVGIKVEHIFGRYHSYGDVLFGRSEIQYQGGGYVSPNQQYLYLQSFSNVLSFGGGADIDVTRHFAAKVDLQLWHQSVPVTASGTLNSLAITAGVVYRFDFNKRPKPPRPTPAVAPRPAAAASTPAPSADSATPASTSP
jgi:hypothetical protein